MNKTTNVTVRTIEDYSNAFGEKFKAGVAAIKEAAEIYAEAMREYPKEARVTFMERYPGVGQRTWYLLERIGNGHLNPNVMLLPYDAAKRIGTMPIEIQDRIFNSGTNGFKVVSRTSLEPHILPVTALTAKAADVLIDTKEGRIRTVEEQRRYIDEKRRAENPVGIPVTVERKPYAIVGDKVRIGGVQFDLWQLKAIVRELEGAKK